MADKTDAERELEAVEKTLGEPVFLEFADSTLKARRNLLSFATIAIAFGWWHLALSSSPTLFGVQLQNLSTEVVAWGLLWTVLYLLVHFVWLAWDTLQEWRLRQTGTRLTMAAAARWGNAEEDSPSDPRQSTLYTWWHEQQRHLGHSKEVADSTRETLRPWIEQGLPGDVDDKTKALLLAISTNVEVLQGAISHATKVLESHRPPVSLDRFDGAFRRFARSQNLRWILVEFGVPVLVGLGGLIASVAMIRQPVKASPVQTVPIVLAPAASAIVASPTLAPAPTAPSSPARASQAEATTPASGPPIVVAKPATAAANK